jgi:AcrR family transcriptional regulator
MFMSASLNESIRWRMVRQMVHKRSQLGREDWVKAGFRLLAAKGPEALKAEVIARTMKTTKGSFYWHFDDVRAYHREMLRIWEEQATIGIIAAVESEALPAAEKLMALAQLISRLNAENEFGGLRAEPALRTWSLGNSVAAKALRRVEANRVDYVASLFVDAGFNDVDSRKKAETFYALFVGLQTMSAQQPIDVRRGMMEGLELLLRD